MNRKRPTDTKIGILRQALLWQLERFIPWEAIEDLLWGMDESGGPYNIRGNIHVYILHLRKRGYNIEIWNKVGVRMKEAPTTRPTYSYKNPRGRYAKRDDQNG